MNASRRVVRLRMRAGSRAAVAAAGLALVLAGCTVTNPQETVTPFDAGDGRSGQIGGHDANTGINLRNFLVVSTAKGAPGRVVGALSNKSGAAAQVQLAIVTTGSDGQLTSLGQTTVPLQPGEFAHVGWPSEVSSGAAATPSTAASSVGTEPPATRTVDFTIPAVPVAPGAVLQLVAGTPASGNTSFTIPVLPAVGEYQALAPSASPSAQPSTVTPTGSVSPSANPSGAASQPPGSTPGQEPTASAS